MTPEELAKLSPEERARLEEAQQKALRILNNRINEGARPQRHRRFVLVVFAYLVGAILLIQLVVWLVSLVR